MIIPPFLAININLYYGACRNESQFVMTKTHKNAQPADIVAFHSPVSHVGIYLSEEEFIHAPPLPGYNVRISSFIGYWEEQLTGVVHYIEND